MLFDVYKFNMLHVKTVQIYGHLGSDVIFYLDR